MQLQQPWYIAHAAPKPHTSHASALSACVTFVMSPTTHTSGTRSVRSGVSVTKLRRIARHTSSYVGRSLQREWAQMVWHMPGPALQQWLQSLAYWHCNELQL